MTLRRTTYTRITTACLFLGAVSVFGADHTDNSLSLVIGGCAALVAIVTYFAQHWRSESLHGTIPSEESIFLQYLPGLAVAMLAIGAPLLVWAVIGYGLWEQVGISIKILMGVLVVMALASAGIFFERLFTFRQATIQSKLFASQVAKHLKDRKLEEAISFSQSKDYRYSHLGAVVLAGLQEYKLQQDRDVALNKDEVVDSVHRAIHRAATRGSADLKRGIGVLATIGSIAVLVGLMATTFGIINAFQGITAIESDGLNAVLAGASEALVGTAIGFFVAIPAIWFFNYLTKRIEFFAVEMDNSSSELVDYFIKKS